MRIGLVDQRRRHWIPESTEGRLLLSILCSNLVLVPNCLFESEPNPNSPKILQDPRLQLVQLPAERAAINSKILKRTSAMPLRSAKRPDLHKHGSTELMTIGFGSVVLGGSTVAHSFLVMYSCSRFERLYLHERCLVRMIS